MITISITTTTKTTHERQQHSNRTARTTTRSNTQYSKDSITTMTTTATVPMTSNPQCCLSRRSNNFFSRESLTCCCRCGLATRGSCPQNRSRRSSFFQSLAAVPTIQPQLPPSSFFLPSGRMTKQLGDELEKELRTFFANGAFPHHRRQSINIELLLSPQRQYNDVVNKTAVRRCRQQTKNALLPTRTGREKRQTRQRRQQKHKPQQRKQRQTTRIKTTAAT